MKVKCISDRFNHVHFATQGDGSKKPVKIKPGDTFEVKAIPAEWEGMVVPAGDKAKTDDSGDKTAATSGGTKAQSNESSAKKPS